MTSHVGVRPFCGLCDSLVFFCFFLFFVSKEKEKTKSRLNMKDKIIGQWYSRFRLSSTYQIFVLTRSIYMICSSGLTTEVIISA